MRIGENLGADADGVGVDTTVGQDAQNMGIPVAGKGDSYPVMPKHLDKVHAVGIADPAQVRIRCRVQKAPRWRNCSTGKA